MPDIGGLIGLKAHMIHLAMPDIGGLIGLKAHMVL